jgi:hypothetical protein
LWVLPSVVGVTVCSNNVGLLVPTHDVIYLACAVLDAVWERSALILGRYYNRTNLLIGKFLPASTAGPWERTRHHDRNNLLRSAARCKYHPKSPTERNIWLSADFSVIGPYRMMATDGSAETSTRPIVHAWCVRVNINATRCWHSNLLDST